MITIKVQIEDMAKLVIAHMSDMLMDAVEDRTPLDVQATMEDATGILLTLARRDKGEIRQMFVNGNTMRLLSNDDIQLLEKCDNIANPVDGFEEYEIRVYHKVGEENKLLLVVIYDEIQY